MPAESVVSTAPSVLRSGPSYAEGRIVHTWPNVRLDDFRAVEALTAPGWTSPRYTGWIPVTKILRGMRVR